MKIHSCNMIYSTKTLASNKNNGKYTCQYQQIHLKYQNDLISIFIQ